LFLFSKIIFSHSDETMNYNYNDIQVYNSNSTETNFEAKQTQNQMNL